jgi:hypothetical protein
MWLSRLAEPQPDLPDYVNANNHALFLQITQALHEVLVERQMRTLKTSPPKWLLRLISTLHATRTTVLTFNYDTLVEKAAEMVGLRDWDTGNGVTSGHLVDHLPPGPPGGFWGPDPAQSFRLIKLHGSIDNYWVPGDSTGSTINRWPSLGGWKAPQPLDDASRRRALPGRTPFIVPPAAAKSSFYNNPLTRELWQAASQALRNAEEVALVGYSLPATDLVASGMLAEAVAQQGPRMVIVNLDPEPVAERLIYLGCRASLITTIGGKSAVSTFVEQFEEDASRIVGEKLRETDEGTFLLAWGGAERAATVRRLQAGRDRITLDLEPFESVGQAIAPHPGRQSLPMPTDSLKQYLSEGPKPIFVADKDGQEYPVVASARFKSDFGYGDGSWTMLIPSFVRS